MPEPAILNLAFRFARRELRGGVRGFRIFLMCLALGVASIAGVGSLGAAIEAGLTRDAAKLLGGDAEFRVSQRAVPDGAEAWFRERGRVSEVEEMRAMLRRVDGAAPSLVEVKAVDDSYPLYGTVPIDPPSGLAEALATRDGIAGIAVAPALLDRLGVHIGDRVRLGTATVEIRAVLVKEPDSGTGGFTIGPRVLIAAATLPSTGLIGPGTLSATAIRVRVPEGADPKALVTQAQARFPEAGWRARDKSEASPSFAKFIERTAMFLELVGLTALVLGGVGVGNAVAGHLAARAPVIATFKSLGAPVRLVFAIYGLEILALALLGIAAGLLIGMGLPILVGVLAGDALPVALPPGPYPLPLAVAALDGLLVAGGFGLLPLLRARRIPAAALHRGRTEPDRPTRTEIAAVLAVGLVLIGFVMLTAVEWRLAGWFLLGVVLALGAFRLAGLALMALARRVGRPRLPWVRLAIANLHRPGAPTATIMVSLGLGLTVLVIVALTQASLEAEILGTLPARAPSDFFIDIQPDEAAPFQALVRETPGIGDLALAPSLRARITALAGVPAARANVAPESRWAIESERGLTWAATVPAGSKVVEGSWWPADYTGPPLVSLDRALAKGLHLAIGDPITFNIAGHEITGRVGNLREIEWTSLGINFFTVFSPGALEAAPHTFIATVRADRPEAEATLVRAVAASLPNVSAIRVQEALETVANLLGSLAQAIRLTALVTVLAGLLVLGGAIGAGERRRAYEAVVLKVLGADRMMILRGLAIEYGILSLAGAGLGAVLGLPAAWFLVTGILHADWHFAPLSAGLTLLAGAGTTLLVALLGSLPVFAAKPAIWLRSE